MESDNYTGDLLKRLRRKDAALWKSAFERGDNLAAGLGWLDVDGWMRRHLGPLAEWADEIVASHNFDNVILLGMGGSGLAPKVFSSVFEKQSGYLRLFVIDTTSPVRIQALDADLGRSLFIVSSKSGSTVETADLFAYFYERVKTVTNTPGNRFTAITDAGSWLQRQGESLGFARVFINPSDIGGRYSALSYFGLVPAALIGVDLPLIQLKISRFIRRLDAEEESLTLELALLLGESAVSGKNHLRLSVAEPIRLFSTWVEQLVAESTGKQGAGIVPVCELIGDGPEQKSPRQITVSMGCRYGNGDHSAAAADLSWNLDACCDIAVEFLRWQMATALAASIMDVNPFDQPDVEKSKLETRRFLKGGGGYKADAVLDRDNYIVYIDRENFNDRKTGLPEHLRPWLDGLCEGSAYLGILAYLPDFDEVARILNEIRQLLGRRYGLSATLGYGPRYLHSTGQLHKGGAAEGCFIQLTEYSQPHVAIPGRHYGFHDLHRAQADGDYAVLEQKGLPIMRITLKGDRLTALTGLRGDLV